MRTVCFVPRLFVLLGVVIGSVQDLPKGRIGISVLGYSLPVYCSCVYFVIESLDPTLLVSLHVSKAKSIVTPKAKYFRCFFSFFDFGYL